MKRKMQNFGSMYGSGLDVSGGRLVNNAPNCESGISKLARLRKEEKRQEKIDTMASGYMKAELLSDMVEMMPQQKRHK